MLFGSFSRFNDENIKLQVLNKGTTTRYNDNNQSIDEEESKLKSTINANGVARIFPHDYINRLFFNSTKNLLFSALKY